MRVDIFAGGLYTTLSVRMMPLAKILTSYGIKCNVVKPINWNAIAGVELGKLFSIILTQSPTQYIKTLVNFPDVIIIGRISTPQIYWFLRLLKRKGVRFVFDLDDALFLPVGRLFGVKVRPGSFCLEKILKSADYVTVDSHYLLYYVKAFNHKVDILHVPVDTKLFNPNIRKKNMDNKITIGWQGSPRAHYENLRILIKPLEKIAKKYDIKFKIVSYLGDLRVKQMFKKLERLAEVDYGSERWLPLKEFAKLMIDFDIAVAPLHKALWNEGKSALRVGIAMAMGTPVIASPVGEQKYIIRHGLNGFLARGEDNWIKYLSTLIEDDNLRKRMGREGRKTAEKELSLEVNGRKLYAVLKKVIGYDES